MMIMEVFIHVRPESVEAFIEATKESIDNSLKEPGLIAFDLLQAEDDPNRFVYFEIYKSPDDHAKHRQTTHYRKWSDTVNPMMAETRYAVKYNKLYPPEFV